MLLVATQCDVINTFRDREVGGSNPLAPTILIPFHQLLTAASMAACFFGRGRFVAEIFRSRRFGTLLIRRNWQKKRRKIVGDESATVT